MWAARTRWKTSTIISTFKILYDNFNTKCFLYYLRLARIEHIGYNNNIFSKLTVFLQLTFNDMFYIYLNCKS